MKKFFLIFCVFYSWTAASGAGWAQDGSQDTMFDPLKNKIVSTSETTLRLSQENKALKDELVGLQLEVERYRRDIQQIDPDAFIQERGSSREADGGLLGPSLDPEVVSEAQEIYLTGQGLNIDAAQRLRELRLYDLYFQLRILSLDLKLAELLETKMPQPKGPGAPSGLDEEIQVLEAQYRELSQKVQEEERASATFPREIEMLEMENSALRGKIRGLKDR